MAANTPHVGILRGHACNHTDCRAAARLLRREPHPGAVPTAGRGGARALAGAGTAVAPGTAAGAIRPIAASLIGGPGEQACRPPMRLAPGPAGPLRSA